MSIHRFRNGFRRPGLRAADLNGRTVDVADFPWLGCCHE